MSNPNFNCSQQDLYTGARIVWQLYKDNLASFMGYSPIYTEAYGSDREAEIDAAERLPDKAGREAVASEVKRQLGLVNKDVIFHYGLFKSYIGQIYNASVLDLKYAAIGEAYYAKANANSWGNTQAMLAQTIPFLDDNLTELMSKNIIPLTFPDKLKGIAQSFKDKYAESIAADKATNDAKSVKDSANMTVFSNILLLNKTAQAIFRNEPTTAKLFVWASILDQTHGTRPAGVSGKMTIEGTKTSLSGVNIRIEGTDKTMLTDKDGRYDISPLSSGKYVAIVEIKGYETQSITFEVKVGVTTRLNVTMKPLV